MNWTQANLPFSKSGAFDWSTSPQKYSFATNDEWQEHLNRWYEEQEKIEQDTQTFCKKGLNKPGTVIKLQNGTIHVIGSINKYGGTCDDCMGIDPGDIVAEYAIIYEWKEGQVA